jgi:hypothetical protein
MENRNNISDSLVVCAKCKWRANVDNELDYTCLKAKRLEQFPEEITVVRYKVTHHALAEFRANNNGKCPYFEQHLSLFQRLKKMLGL